MSLDTPPNALKQNLLTTVEQTQVLLYENREWRSRYENYATKITRNLDLIESVRSSFRQWDPLMVYLNTSSVLDAKRSVRFQLRYHGQTVADLTGSANGKHKLSTNPQRKNNLRDFDCALTLAGVDWAGKEAAEFRRFFKNRKSPRNEKATKKNEEHRLESLWLSELEKREDKALRWAKPVKIGKARFPMPTPLSASLKSKPVKYSGPRGGGIDILARVGTGGANTYLCVMELKAKNEPPKHALRQSVAYTTFIRELLRSASGSMWWSLFGFGGGPPEQLVLCSACLIPSGKHNDHSFRDMELAVDDDIIQLHYVYFTEAKNRITGADTSLEWL